jgi:hypothetical protein
MGALSWNGDEDFARLNKKSWATLGAPNEGTVRLHRPLGRSPSHDDP